MRDRTVAAHLGWVTQRGVYSDMTEQDWTVLAALFGFSSPKDMKDFACRQQAAANARLSGNIETEAIS